MKIANSSAPLPWDEDAEICILGSMLIDEEAAQIAVESIKSEHFFLQKHRHIFTTLAGMLGLAGGGVGGVLDEITVCAKLKSNGLLGEVGGREYIGRLIEKTPSAAGVEDYCRIVVECGKRRELILLSTDIAEAAHKGKSLDVLIGRMDDIKARYAPKSVIQRVSYPSQLLSMDTENDPGCLIGRRWLCRGGSCVFIGQSGIGKSSATTQAMILWALGLDFFGIRPVRALRSLVIQAENDEGDLSEMFKGVVNGLQLDLTPGEMDQNLCFISESSISGAAFMPWVRGLIASWQPDIVWIDPLHAFFGGDINKGSEVSAFLRNGLGAISQETGVCWMIVHHTPKPMRGARGLGAAVAAGVAGGLSSDRAYDGHGSAELTNWPRAVLNLKQVQQGGLGGGGLGGGGLGSDGNIFELMASKRGGRSGLTDEHGNQSQSILIRHASHGILWERAIVGTATDDKSLEFQANVEELLGSLVVGTLYTKTEIKDIAIKLFGKDRNHIGQSKTKYGKVYFEVLRITAAAMGMHSRKP